MHYKTIALALIEDRPKLHEHLRTSRTLLATMEQAALLLRECHQRWKADLEATSPQNDPAQIASLALELAIEELQTSLPPESDGEAEPLSLDAVIVFLQPHSSTG